MARIGQFAIFIAVASLIVGGLHFYLWIRLVRDTAIPPPWRQVLTWVIIVLGASIPIAMFLGRTIPFDVSRLVSLVPYIWMGAWFMMVIALLGVDLVKLVAFLVKKAGGGGALIEDPSRRVALSRIVGGAIGATALTFTGAGIFRAMGRVAVTRVEVTLPRLPEALDGFRIAQITDLHIGLTLGRDWLEEVVDQIEELQPDLIAITGDLVDGTPDRLLPQVEPLARLRAPHGAYFVTGNHEYYSGVDEWLPVIEQLGIRVLHNERVEVERDGAAFDLAGIDDYSAGRLKPGHGPHLEQALARRDPSREVVLLSHQPKIIHDAADRGVGLVLAGHTHGGQIWPFNHLARLQQPYISGLHKHADKTWIYVSDGTGFWGPPIRVGTRSEIAEVVLRRG
jgi:predicted MPP superfamily phosphohydrolase